MSKLFLNFNEASIPVIKEMYWKELREMTKKEVEYSSLAYSLFKSRERIYTSTLYFLLSHFSQFFPIHFLNNRYRSFIKI